MKAPSRKKPLGRAAPKPAVEQYVYGISCLIGIIRGRPGAMIARTAAGKNLGRFKTSNAAMAAITSTHAKSSETGRNAGPPKSEPKGQ